MIRDDLFWFLGTLDADWFTFLSCFLERLASRARLSLSVALWEFRMRFFVLFLGVLALGAIRLLLGCLCIFFGLLQSGFDIDVDWARISLLGAIWKIIRVLLVVLSISRSVMSVRLIRMKKDLLVSPRLRQLYPHSCISGDRVWWRRQFKGGMKPLPVVASSHWGGRSPWLSLIGLNQVQLVLMCRRRSWQVFLILWCNSYIVEMCTLFKALSQALPESKLVPCRFLVRI